MAAEQSGKLEQGDLALAYATLLKNVEALEQEWKDSGLVRELEEIETDYLEEQTARELGLAGALAVGLSVLHQTVKALLPAQVATPVVGGCWVLGGGYIVFRLTAGTVAGWVGVMERNARRKRQLRRKLLELENRISVMLATQAVLMGEQPAQPEHRVAAAATGLPGPRASPAASTDSSSVEMVEAPAEDEGGAPASVLPSGSGGTASSSRPAEGSEARRRFGGKPKKT